MRDAVINARKARKLEAERGDWRLENFDIVIIGAGPAGLSAALNASVRNKKVAICSTDYRDSGLYRAEVLDNVLGVDTMTGAQYLKQCMQQIEGRDVAFFPGRVLSIVPMGARFLISVGDQVLSAGKIVLALGILQASSFSGEQDLLGRGVSYCATCDGMLYRGKDVAVIARSNEAIGEANYLAEIGCKVTVIPDRRDLSGLRADISVRQHKRISILGKEQVEGIGLDDETLAVSAVFILRNSVVPSRLLPGLELGAGHILVDRQMQTNLDGVYAAGDCTGKPYQIAKATGEGLIAALAAVDALDHAARMNTKNTERK